ncbi:MAG: NAD(+) synthase [Cytophagales bacterium]|nr:MAG: NAD(+) synthase [Cytophagales bacterium]
MQTIRIAGAALNQTPIHWEHNKQNIIYAIEYARMNGVELLCLPEMCLTGYGCEDLFLSDWLYETAMQKLIELLPFTYEIAVCIGLPILYKNKRYNCTCLIQNEKIIGFYAKQFLANDGIFYEKRWFESWDKKEEFEEFFISILNQHFPFGDKIFEIKTADNQILKIGFEICEDAWRTIDRPAHSHKKRGADLIINPSASNFEFGKTQKRENLIVNSSLDFDCTYIYANLLGNEAGKIIFDGEIIIAQKGKLLNKNTLLSFQDFNVIWANVSISNPKNSISTIEPQVFETKEIEFRDAVSLALFDYMRKSKSQGFVLSLSGGADSCCCAIMVSEMIKKGKSELGETYFNKKSGIKNINDSILTCAYQGTENSSDETFKSAKELAESINAVFHHWSIDEEVDSYSKKIETALNRKLTWQKDDLALQNIQARTRSPIIWMLANIQNALLITTSNRSEGDVGYCTMDGDTSGSISPIAGVDKDYVKKWLIWAEKNLHYSALSFVNNLQPTAELRPLETHQTDEKDLMPYYILNEIELLAIRQWKSPLEVYERLVLLNLEDKILLKQHIKRFFQMWARSQWKRERYAPAFHLDLHNVDPRSWCRFPILSSSFEFELDELEKIQ